jgi:hypothetical protein
MYFPYSIGSIAGAAAMAMSLAGAQAHDESKYPDWNGQWRRPAGINNQWDPTKPWGKEGAPLTPEYQAIYEANLKDQLEGGQGTDPTYTCIPDGMPRAMNVIFPMEIIILPKTTYIMIEYFSMLRRIYTDGREFPVDDGTFASFIGYSIGKWVDTDGDGRHDELLVETRFMKNPRSFDASGIPLHADAETIVKERFYQEKDKPDVLHDEVTTIDHALTRPWTVVKNYNRVRNPRWFELVCAENNEYIKIGDETYMRSPDGRLKPQKKGQKPPDLSLFNTTNDAAKK